jgi:hypothetical protein
VAGGKRAGARPSRRFRPALLALAVGITACVVAWGYLVYAAIDFGAAARRDASAGDWLFLSLAAIGAVACLFLGLMLVVRLSRALGITHAPTPQPKRDPDAPAGGHRAAR